MSIPRIQFRLSKLQDQDLIDFFESFSSKEEATDITSEAKRLIRIGIRHNKPALKRVVLDTDNKVNMMNPIRGDVIVVIPSEKERVS